MLQQLTIIMECAKRDRYYFCKNFTCGECKCFIPQDNECVLDSINLEVQITGGKYDGQIGKIKELSSLWYQKVQVTSGFSGRELDQEFTADISNSFLHFSRIQ